MNTYDILPYQSLFPATMLTSSRADPDGDQAYTIMLTTATNTTWRWILVREIMQAKSGAMYISWAWEMARLRY